MGYHISDTDLQIVDSFKVSKYDMLATLQEIKSAHPDSQVWQRTLFHMMMEWCAHNLAYALGLWKDRTASVDLNTPPDRPEWVYTIVGCVGFVFIT